MARRWRSYRPPSSSGKSLGARPSRHQQTEAVRRALELERAALAEQETDLQQREAAFEQTRAKLDEALAAAKQGLVAMQEQLHAHQQESARLLSHSEAEVRRLHKSLDEALGSKEALRETMAMALAQQQRAAEDAEERHRVHERRRLAEVDRERLATAKAVAELAKVQKAHAADAQAARTALLAAQQALHQAQGARHDVEAAAAQQMQALQIAFRGRGLASTAYSGLASPGPTCSVIALDTPAQP
jgi:hypothetical protein